jgi:hypothetical protein
MTDQTSTSTMDQTVEIPTQPETPIQTVAKTPEIVAATAVVPQAPLPPPPPVFYFSPSAQNGFGTWYSSYWHTPSQIPADAVVVPEATMTSLQEAAASGNLLFKVVDGQVVTYPATENTELALANQKLLVSQLIKQANADTDMFMKNDKLGVTQTITLAQATILMTYIQTITPLLTSTTVSTVPPYPVLS